VKGTVSAELDATIATYQHAVLAHSHTFAAGRRRSHALDTAVGRSIEPVADRLAAADYKMYARAEIATR